MHGSRGTAAVLAAMIVAALTTASGAAPPKPRELAKVGFVLESAVAGDWAGYGMTVGDFDGDGILDLAIGAWCDDTIAPGNGATYILYGPITEGRSLADADAVIRGTDGGFGENLTALDMDGDGADELVVGAPGPFIGTGPLGEQCFTGLIGHPGFNRPGEVFVFRGGERLSGALDATAVADSVITGYAPLDFAGWGVGNADLDGDGKDELVVGANFAAATTGAAFLFADSDLPASASALEADAHFLGEAPHGLFGMQIASGDVDGDGIDDLLITGPAMLDGGATYVFLGGELPSGLTLASTADIIFKDVGSEADGWGLAVGDLDGDGAADIVFGTPFSSAMTSVFYGPVDRRGTVPLTDADVRISGDGRRAGYAVAVANLDGEDRSDLFIGAPGDMTVSHAGAVHRLVGPLAGDIDAMTTGFLYLGEVGDKAGIRLAVGDVTGNGYEDLIVGAPANGVDLEAHLTGTEIRKPGRVYIIPGEGD